MLKRTIFAIGVWLLISLPAMAAEDAPPVTDVRVLIDMSGSMKKNDPNNLRIPAVRLLTQLMPEGSNSGVWTFGQYVNMLASRAPVDKAWKDKAYNVADQINSKGLYTNIEGVLKDATWDWSKPDEKSKRSVVLLTDGLVDISKNPKENAASRKRILEMIVPRLKQAGASVNTIGLSDDADDAFLQQLSSSTGGWYQEVRNADQLERVFLRMFEKSVPADTLPLNDNKIRIDSSIKELTLVVFRGEHGKETKLVLPSGQILSKDNAPASVRWRHEKRYDLITIDAPVSGDWTLDAQVDPDNRAMVVTNLRVKASRFPNTMLRDEVMPYYVSLLQEKNVITNELFLDLVNIKMARYLDNTMQHSQTFTDDGKHADERAKDGKFTGEVALNVPAGDYSFQLDIDGGTFKRSGQQLVRVVDGPVMVTAKKESQGNPSHYSLSIVPYAELIEPDSLVINAMLAKEGVGELNVDIPRTGPTEWRLDMNVKSGDVFKVSINVSAKKLNGNKVNAEMGSFTIGGEMDGRKLVRESAHQPELEPEPVHAPASVDIPVTNAPESAATHEPASAESLPTPPAVPRDTTADSDTQDASASEDHPPLDEHAPAAEEEPNWIMVAAKVIGFNVLLIGAGLFVWWKFIRVPKPSTEDEEASTADNAEDKG